MYDYNRESEADFNLQQNYYEIAIIQAKIKQERYFKKLWLFLIFILVVASFYLLDHHPELLSTNQALLALGITWLGLLPSLQYLSDRKRPPIPFFPLVGLFYATSFGLPLFSKHVKVSGRMSWANVNAQALILVLLGILGMNIAFYVFKFYLWRNVTPIKLSGLYSRSKLLTLLWVILSAHIAFLYIPFINTIPSLGQLLDPIGYVAYGIFYIILSRGKLPVFQAWIFLGVFVPLEVIRRISSGLLAEIMLLGLFMVIIIWYERKRIPVIFISITMLVYLIFSPVKSEYRHLTWNRNFSDASALEKTSLFLNLTIKHYQGVMTSSQVNNSDDSANNAVIERSAHILLFSDVMLKTPIIVPYWNGETYLPLFTSFIPRALWSDKPVETVGNQFGHRYRYLDSTDKNTSWNLPWIVEMYANFGTLGVLIGMPLVGIFSAFLEQKLNSPAMDSVEVVIGATVLFRLIYQESNFSVMTGTVVNLTLALYVMFRFLVRSQPQKPL